MPKSSKRNKLIESKVDRDKLHSLTEAIDLIKSVKATKFDEEGLSEFIVEGL